MINGTNQKIKNQKAEQSVNFCAKFSIDFKCSSVNKTNPGKRFKYLYQASSKLFNDDLLLNKQREIFVFGFFELN